MIFFIYKVVNIKNNRKMISLGDIHVYTHLDNSINKLFSVKYELIKQNNKTRYINLHFIHNEQCTFYDYKLDQDVLKLSFIHDNVIKCADILLIYV
jgi:hypothetical protein